MLLPWANHRSLSSLHEMDLYCSCRNTMAVSLQRDNLMQSTGILALMQLMSSRLTMMMFL